MSMLSNPGADRVRDIDNNGIDKTWENLLQGSESIDQCVHQLQRIAILHKRCGSNRHQECWHQVDSELQYEERVKISNIKRGGHSHRQTKSRPPQSDDDEIIVDPLGPSPAKELLDKYNNGTLTKGDVRDFTFKRDAKEESGRRIKVPAEVRPDGGVPHYKKMKYDPRIDVASTKPSDCNRELQKLLQDILPHDKEDITEHESDDILGVDEWHISNGIEVTIRRIIGQGNNIRKLADDFSCYSSEEFHPLNQHNNIISNICNKLDTITNNLNKELNTYHDGDSYITDIYNYIINTAVPSLNKITMDIRSNIIVMQGSFYSKPHAVSIVTKYEKHSKERSNIIQDMINNERVPNRSALDKVLKIKKNNQILVDDMWHTRKTSWMIKPDCKLVEERIDSITDISAQVRHCRMKMVEKIWNQRHVSGYVNKTMANYEEEVKQKECHDDIIARGLGTTNTTTEATQYVDALTDDVLRKAGHYRTYEKKDIIKEIVAKQNELRKEAESELIKMNKVKEKQFNNVHIGSLVLSVQTVTMGRNWTPNITTELYAPPIPTQISNTIGLTGDRLYFSPHQFPVTDVDTAGDSEAFQQLKDYIKYQSSLVGDSPLVFHGTESGGKRFICKYALKYNWKDRFGPQTPFKRCAFAIVVKWDKYGFYINSSKPNHLHNRVPGKTQLDDEHIIQRKCVVGCEFHCHPTVSNDLSKK